WQRATPGPPADTAAPASAGRRPAGREAEAGRSSSSSRSWVRLRHDEAVSGPPHEQNETARRRRRRGPSPRSPTMNVAAEALTQFCVRVLLPLGVSDRDAGLTVELLVLTDTRGVFYHG